MDAIPLIGLVVAVIALVVVVARFSAYRALYCHTEEDLNAARRDTLSRSRTTVTGKVLEQLVPLFPVFTEEFNPRDARFLGSPIDFVVFDGLDGGELREIIFLEIKSTDGAKLTLRERQIQRCVEEGWVRFDQLLLDTVSRAAPHAID